MENRPKNVVFIVKKCYFQRVKFLKTIILEFPCENLKRAANELAETFFLGGGGGGAR